MSENYTPAQLRAMLAAAEQAERDEAERAAASAAVTDRVAAAIRDLTSLSAAAGAAGLDTPDLATILAAAMQRATPATPDALAAVIAPDPVVPNDGATRRTRRHVVRDWSRVESGSIWSATLAGQSGRVKVTLTADGPRFTATTGNRGTFPSVSRAVQSACGDPAGAGRRGEATVNGYLALTNDAGDTLDAVTAPTA
jgi:hypothetical protein